MRTHFLCMGIDYWLVTRDRKTMIEEKEMGTCNVEQKEIFIFNMYAREVVITTLPKS